MDLQEIEGEMENLLTRIRKKPASQIIGTELDGDARRRKLLGELRRALADLDDTDAAMSLDLGDPNTLTDEDRAVNQMSHAMGCKIPAEYR